MCHVWQEKDPLHYNPSKLLDPRSNLVEEGPRKKRRMFGKLVTTSGGRPGARAARSSGQLQTDNESPDFVTIGKFENGQTFMAQTI